MLRKLLGVALALMALEGMAYPTSAQIAEARPLVIALMADDVAAEKANRKTAEAVGDAALALVPKASGEAAKLQLFEGAFQYYVRGRAYGKAAQTIQKMRSEISDVEPKMIVDLIRSKAKGVKGSSAPELFAIYRTARFQVTMQEALSKTRIALRKTPNDKDLVRKLGEAQALSGDWKSALETFARFKGGVGIHARAEKNGRDLFEAANFWWSYESFAGADGTAIFRGHAVALYRQTLEGGELDGLRKEVAEKRIAQMPKTDGAVNPGTQPTDNDEGVSSRSEGRGSQDSQQSAKSMSCRYLVIDLSGGPSAKRYPITRLTAKPAGGWTDVYKTTKLVLRRIEPGSYIMGDDQNNESHRVTITKPFYIGVFEVTQRQWELVKGDRPSFWRGPYWATRPVEKVSYNDIRGKDKGSQWPASNAVDDDSFLGRLRARTKLVFDLPTEGQWEYACRAGTTSDYNGAGGIRRLGRYRDNGGWNESTWGKFDWGIIWQKSDRECGAGHGTAPVGLYAPNDWGVYDCHGNVWEWCLDWKADHRAYGTDPVGGVSGGTRVGRGGDWHDGTYECRSDFRGWMVPWDSYGDGGFRLSCSVGTRK